MVMPKINLILQHLRSKRQFISYSIIGASGALLDLATFLVLYNILQFEPLIATAISTSLGITNNFVWNVLFNFRVRDKIHHRYLLFYAIGLFGLFISVGVIYALHNVMGMSANLAKLISIPIVVILQYSLNSRISFASDLSSLASGIFESRRNGKT